MIDRVRVYIEEGNGEGAVRALRGGEIESGAFAAMGGKSFSRKPLYRLLQGLGAIVVEKESLSLIGAEGVGVVANDEETASLSVFIEIGGGGI